MTKLEQRLDKGIKRYNSGDYLGALEVFRKLHRELPLNVPARFFLACTYIQLGRYAEAIPLIEPVIVEFPLWKDAHNNLAVAYHKTGDREKALVEYDRTLDLDPEMMDAVANRAYCLHEMQRDEEALDGLNRVLAVTPDNLSVLVDKAVILGDLGRQEQAVEVANDAIGRDNLDANSAYRAACLLVNRDVPSAMKAFERLLEIEPEHVMGNVHLACLVDRTTDPINREAALQRELDLLDVAVKVDPDCLDAQINRAAVLYRMHRLDESMRVFETIQDKAQHRADFYANYGALLMAMTKYDEAVELFKRAIEMNPKDANTCYNWGATLQLQGEYEAALDYYTRTLELDPGHVNARTGRSLLYLVLGRFQEGWADYEIRKKNEQFTGRVINDHLLAKHDMDGRRVLLHSEQGLGDTIQFIRYASIIKAMGAYVVAECHDGLKELVATCPGIDEVYDRTEVSQDLTKVVFHAQANLMSLPYVLKADTIDSIPSQTPYFTVPEESRTHWAKRIAELTPEGTRLKVGIVWAGNPKHRTDLLRSTTLKQFGALAKIDGLVCFSLQKGEKAEEQLNDPPAGLKIVALGGELKSFTDTAAAMEKLDLVIAVDTSVVHLAGAIGVPVWTLVAKSPDWRWMLDRDDTPWYPTMRLFRQNGVKSWEPVFDDIVVALQEFGKDPVKWQLDEALAKFERGDRNRAKVELFCIARRFPTDTRVLNTLGELLWADDDTQEALKIFVTAMQMMPGDRRTVRNCAEVFASFGQVDNARMLYRSYLAQHPDDREFIEALRALDGERVLATAA